MNLTEAINSGLDFRVAGDADNVWMRVDPNGLDGHTPIVVWCGSDTPVYLTPRLVTMEFEVKTPSVTTTRSQFWAAIHSSSSSQLGQELYLDHAGIKRLARKLGLEGG